MSVPTDRRYSTTHEWYKLEGDVATMGITQFAADELTDITYIELPKEGARIEAGKPCGELESVKATSDLYSAISGEVVARNADLSDHPERVNEDAFTGGWMLKIRVQDRAPLEALMDAQAYEAQIAGA